ncbi:MULTISPECIES: recombination mediator RecR [unclassified Meiothermus]|uniref:recombination mediator RecR n=1 Tax=unclassified Meiothermus TaxID=370471 RepID=UPI000D7BE3B0|nr:MULTISPECIES: recombination mediator RecR [unclassified Meiothermus]PZA08738.1 recombination protein RecR [Meiothermus sp. Pnk-1]RYM40642.1 recombination protein RecR [Meiothermus sp. PNK-Is4]
MRYPERLLKLVRALAVLPGVGPKTAQKLGLHLVMQPDAAQELLAALDAARALHPCPICGNLAEDELCPICADEHRERSLVCVVESVGDLMALERSGEYGGLYHVLGGALNPLEGIGPEQLNLGSLYKRLEPENPEALGAKVEEVILATSMTVEGEATAAYLADALKERGIKATRLAYGLPAGGSLEYADEVTLARALENRRGLGE